MLGSSPARIREMIRFGELTQERVGDRWLIPVRDINRLLSPSPQPRDRKTRAAPKEQRPKPDRKEYQAKFYENKTRSLQGISSKGLGTKNTHDDLAAEIERLARRMKQIDGELRDLRSGLLNDEKRERIEKLKTEKRNLGKNLQKLQTELSRRER